MNDKNPSPPVRGQMVKWKGRQREVLAAYTIKPSGEHRIKIGNTWHTVGKAEDDDRTGEDKG